MKPINESLVELRKDYGLPQMTLAKAFGISQNAIDCYEYGTSVPHEALTKYADYFDVVLIWKFNRFALNRYDSTHYKSISQSVCGGKRFTEHRRRDSGGFAHPDDKTIADFFIHT